MEYLVYDVFSDQAGGGNPLAVVLDAEGLSTERMQRIAREFNFSETTFVLPAREGADARVRIFTPTMEVPFAGHPTVGTAMALHELGRAGPEMVLELGVGPIPVTVSGGRARFRTEVPLEIWAGPPVEVVAASIGIERSAIRTDRHPPVIAGVGLPFAIAELGGGAALRAAMPSTEAFRAFDAHWPCDTHYDLLVYTRDSSRVNARMFAPLDGIPEDPATGSAAAALCAYLQSLEGGVVTLDIIQGVEMGRPSHISATADGGGVAISGQAVKVMEGRLLLPLLTDMS